MLNNFLRLKRKPCCYSNMLINSRQCSSNLKTEEIKELEVGQVIGNINQDRKLGVIFECSVCQGKCAKTFSHHSYTKGVVIITCPNCAKRHLIADNLGWFKDTPVNVETMAAEKGEKITRINDMSQLNIFDMKDVNGIEDLKNTFNFGDTKKDTNVE